MQHIDKRLSYLLEFKIRGLVQQRVLESKITPIRDILIHFRVKAKNLCCQEQLFRENYTA